MTSSDKDLAQFKTTSGAEIVCEVVEWPDSDSTQLIARNVMSIESVDLEVEKVYMFRPWIHFLDSNDELTVLNVDHIISINTPNKYLAKQYRFAVKEMHANAAIRNAEYDLANSERMKRLRQITGLDPQPMDDSSSSSNVISFPKSDDTIH